MADRRQKLGSILGSILRPVLGSILGLILGSILGPILGSILEPYFNLKCRGIGRGVEQSWSLSSTFNAGVYQYWTWREAILPYTNLNVLGYKAWRWF